MPQYQGIWTLAQAAQLQSTQRWATDPLFENTTLLLQADNAPNGAQNNTFLDSSSNNFTITRNGNTTQGTFTPFSQSPGWWGNYFNGTGNYLRAPSSSAFNFGTGDFTIEAWVLDAGSGLGPQIYDAGLSNSAGSLWFGWYTDILYFRIDGTANDITYAYGIPKVWTHVAATRQSGTVRIFINGVQVASGTRNQNVTQQEPYIGYGAGTNSLGYTSNMRVVKGTAVYTSNFTPSPIPLTAITNTSLLTCQSNRFVDNSTNNFTLTVTGTPSVQAFSPFAPQYQYTPSVTGGSGYGGSGVGYLLAPASSNFQYPGDFSIETWLYVTTSNVGPIWGTAGGGGSDQIYLNGSTAIYYDNTNFTYFNSASSVVPYAWSHICITRQSGTLRVMINGILIGSKAQAGTLGSATTGPGIFIRASLDDQVGGPVYMTDLRVCKGSVPTSYQTSSTTAGTTIFTPPTQAVTTTSQGATSSNVSLLTNFTNASIYDGTLKNDLQTVGNAQVSTSVVKYGTGSMYFDGTGDYLTSNTATTDLYAFGSGDFTIECWVYLNSVVGYGIIYDGRPTTAQTTQPTLFHSGGTIAYYTNGANRIVGSALSTSTWYHIALARSGTSTKLFVDGTQVGSTYTDSTVYTNTSGRPWIGADSYSIGNNLLNGYIDDLRVTKGYARYTANFTPPSVALPRQ